MDAKEVLGVLWHKWYKKWGNTSGIHLQGNGIKVMLADVGDSEVLSSDIPTGTIFQGQVGIAKYGLWAKVETDSGSTIMPLNPDCSKDLFRIGPSYPSPKCPVKNYVPVLLIAAAIPLSEVP